MGIACHDVGGDVVVGRVFEVRVLVGRGLLVIRDATVSM